MADNQYPDFNYQARLLIAQSGFTLDPSQIALFQAQLPPPIKFGRYKDTFALFDDMSKSYTAAGINWKTIIDALVTIGATDKANQIIEILQANYPNLNLQTFKSEDEDKGMDVDFSELLQGTGVSDSVINFIRSEGIGYRLFMSASPEDLSNLLAPITTLSFGEKLQIIYMRRNHTK